MSRPVRRSAWQDEFVTDLEAVARNNPDLVVIRERRKPTEDGDIPIQLAIHTAAIPHNEGGLLLEPTEIIEITVPQSRYRPPSVHVTHSRFVGYPHVLQGVVLCIYLDTSREWNPSEGATGFLNRVWGWFESAAAGKFNPHTALFHAVGGTDHTTDSTPTVVIRDELGDGKNRVTLVPLNDHRFDLALNDEKSGLRAPILTAPDPLSLGTGTMVSDLATRLDDPTMSRGGRPAPGMLPKQESLRIMLTAAAKRNPSTSPQPFILRVPHPVGGPPHLLVGSLPSGAADTLRLGGDLQDLEIEWWRVSDERASVRTRRDSTHPTAAFVGRTVLLFGCGGLGSWMAEFIARAGAKKIVLSNPAVVSGGLLVRQNYAEADVGASKESALVSRLRAVHDDIEVDVLDDSESFELKDFDLVIDASVNLALSQVLSSMTQDTLVAQVAVDPRTAAVGMVLIKPRELEMSMAELDVRAGTLVQADPSLEDYQSMWSSSTHSMLVPTRGCSVPTFYGSAADLAAAAGVMVSLLGTQLLVPTAGVHLFTLPHAASLRSPTTVFLSLSHF